MRFSRILINAVVLLGALAWPVGAFATPSTPTTTPPAEASPDATVSECYTPDVVVQVTLNRFPGTDIKSVSTEPPYVIIFTNPEQSTDLVAHFDENNCFSGFTEQSKTGA